MKKVLFAFIICTPLGPTNYRPGGLLPTENIVVSCGLVPTSARH